MAKYRSTFPVLTDAANYLLMRQVADLLGVEPAEAESIIAQPGFPEPARTIRNPEPARTIRDVPVWLEEDVVAYLRDRAHGPVKLAGTHEVADILGVPVETVRTLHEKHDLTPPFPEPLAELQEITVWRLEDVLEWKRARERAWRDVPGRP